MSALVNKNKKDDIIRRVIKCFGLIEFMCIPPECSGVQVSSILHGFSSMEQFNITPSRSRTNNLPAINN